MDVWPDLWKLNVDECMRRKSCRDEKWPKLERIRSLQPSSLYQFFKLLANLYHIA